MSNSKLTRRLFCLLLCAAVFCLSLCTAAGATGAGDGDVIETPGPSPSDLAEYYVFDDPAAALYHGDPTQVEDPALKEFLEGYQPLAAGLQDDDLYFSEYDIDMTINPDRSVDVVETIDAVFNEEMHGITRTLPTYSSDESFEITNVDVKDWPYEMRGDTLYIGDANRYVSGKHRYVISYSAIYLDDIIPDYDRFYRDILGSETATTICNVTARVRLPAVISASDLMIYDSSWGDTDRLSIFLDGDIFYLYNTRWLEPYEAITFDVRLPEGSFSEPSRLQPELIVDSMDIAVDFDKYGNGVITESYKLHSPNGSDFYRWIDDNQGAFICDESYSVDGIEYTTNGRTTSTDNHVYVYIPADTTPTELVIKYNVFLSVGKNKSPKEFSFFPTSAFDRLTQFNSITFALRSEPGIESVNVMCGSRMTSNQDISDPRYPYGFTTSLSSNSCSAISYGTFPVGQNVSIMVEGNGIFVHKRTAGDIALPIAGVFVLVVLFVLISTKKEKQLVPTMEYYAPGGLNPAEVGCIIDHNPDAMDITSLIFYWASHGHISIEMRTKKHFTLHRLSDLDEKHRMYERTMFKALWILGDGVSVKDTDLSENFYDEIAKAQRAVKKVFTGKQSIENTKRRALFYLFTFGSLALTLLVASIFGRNESGLPPYIMSSLAFLALLPVIIDSLYKNKYKNGKKIPMFICIIIFAGFAFLFGLLFIPGRAFGTVSVLVTLILLTVAMLFSGKLRTRTDFGTDVLGRCIGFKQFLETAEKSRLEMLLEENPDYYYDILPYAHVLGVSKLWLNKFEGLTLEPPSWFYGSKVTPLTLNVLLNNSFNSLNRSLATPPASSGSGGGFSGGGGFGGGFSGGGGGGGAGGW